VGAGGETFQCETVMRRAVVIVAVVFAAGSPAPGQSGRTLLREGNGQYSEKKYSDAEVSYRKALESVDDVETGRFNLGDALYEQGRYDEAIGRYEDVLGSAKDDGIRARAYHNIGNAKLKNKKYEESIDAYKEALKINPADDDTRYNLEYARRMLQQQQQQQKKQDQKDDKDQKDNKDRQQKKENNDKKQQDNKNREDRQKQDRQKQEKQNQQNKEEQRRRQETPKDQISKADAERILEALKKQEQDVKKKLQKHAPVRVKTDRDW